MRRAIQLAAALLLAVPAAVWGQANQVSASATVANSAVLSGSGDLSFGTVSAVTNTVINAAGGAGSAQRSLNYNHNVRVTFTSVPANLTGSGGATLPVALTCASRIGAAAWSSAVACSSAQLDLDVGATTTSATLGFGGTITAANVANAVAGTYTGTFNIVVTAR